MTDPQAETENYGAESIKVLKGLEAVRKRPGMYIGDTDDGSGLHHMVYEVVDNGIDEALAGHCDKVTVTLYPDNSVAVSDNGRGIPTETHQEEGISAAEVIMTQLHAGGKFDQNSYKVSGGLHGVGVSVVNALSSKLELRIWRNNSEHHVEFNNGETISPLKKIGPAGDKKGTEVRFWASEETFSNIQYDFKTLEQRLRELAFLNSGVTIELVDLRDEKEKRVVLSYEGGVKEFVKYLDRSKVSLINEPIFIYGEKDGISLEVALWWNNAYNELVLPFTNNIPQGDGGTHLAGFRGALTRTVNMFVGSFGSKNKDKVSVTGDDADVDGAHIRTLLLTFFFRKMPELIEKGHIFIAEPPLYKVAKGKSEVYIKDDKGLENYLMDAGVQDTFLKITDDYVLSGRDLAEVVVDANKCIKLLEKAGDDNIKRILEQATLTGVINKIRSLGKDVDGQRILCQRLDNISKEYERGWSSRFEGGSKLSFFRTVRGVEEIVEVDLTKIQSSLIEGLENFSSKFKDIFSGIPVLVKKEAAVELDGPTSLIGEIIRMGEKGISLQRYKGLGEMNADQLWETTLDPDARTLLRVKVDRDRTTEADDLFTCLMGEVVEPRKNFIQEHALSVKNLDF